MDTILPKDWHTFFNEDVTLEPEGYLLLAKNGEMYSGSIEWAYGNLGNSGETLILINSDGDLANELTFGNSSPFPSEPNGSGPSMELIDPDEDNTVGINWQASTILGGNTWLSKFCIFYYSGNYHSLTKWRRTLDAGNNS